MVCAIITKSVRLWVGAAIAVWAAVAQPVDVSAAELAVSLFDRQAVARAEHPPLGLPPIPKVANNPITAEKVALGRKLFFDRRLSHNGTISCAMCHVPEQGFTVNEISTAVGMEGRTVRRNAPTIFNTAYYTSLFHDGRDPDLELQVLGPLSSRVEMGNPSLGYVIETIRHSSDYDGLFERVFGAPVSLDHLGQALAAYQRTVLSGNSPFDRWKFRGDENALTAQAKAGFALFTGKARCVNCHIIEDQSAIFTDNGYHNTGIGYLDTYGPKVQEFEVYLAPGVTGTVTQKTVEKVGLEKPMDLGRYEVTTDPGDRWKYKTPSLRNVALTAPYMHDGSLRRLRDVVEYYNHGGFENPGLSPLIQPLGLSKVEVDALVSFLQSLTGDNINELIADARSVKVGNPTH